MKTISLLVPVLLAAPLQAQVQPGDILVNDLGPTGIEVYRPDGTLVVSASGG